MSLTSDERDWLRTIEGKLDGIKDDVAQLTAFGCAQAPRHDDHETRIRSVEENINQAKGGLRMAHVLSGVIGAVLAFVAGKIWK